MTAGAGSKLVLYVVLSAGADSQSCSCKVMTAGACNELVLCIVLSVGVGT